MEDFNNRKRNKKLKVKNIILTFLLVVTLMLGFVLGRYLPSTSFNDKKNNGTKIFNEIYNTLDKSWLNTSDKDINILEEGLKGFVNNLKDRHSSLLMYEEANSYNQTIDGNLHGIGIGYIKVSKGILVTRVYPGPAKKAGIQEGDIFVKINDLSIAGKTTDEIKSLIVGKSNTSLKVEYLRNNKSSNLALTREQLDTSFTSSIEKGISGQKYGYFKITTFGNGTAALMEKALTTLKEQGVTNLVIDLRDNGGGYLSAAVEILDLFMSKSDILYQMKTKDSAMKPFYGQSDEKFVFNQGYILVNENTASASEIMTLALKENCNYKVIGTKTFGKGTAQSQKQLSNGYVLKYTYGLWYSPKGNTINKVGIKPDYDVSSFEDHGLTTNALEKSYQEDNVSENIASMQKALRILGYDCDRDDGYFSSQTKSQLVSFQTKHNLEPNGIYDEESHLQLMSAIVNYKNQKTNDKQLNALNKML